MLSIISDMMHTASGLDSHKAQKDYREENLRHLYLERQKRAEAKRQLTQALARGLQRSLR